VFLCLFILQEVNAQEYVVIDLGIFGDFGSSAAAINHSGKVVGTVVLDDPIVGSNGHAFLWTEKDGMQDLGDIYGYYGNGAIDINNRGQIVGFKDTECSPSDPGCPLDLYAFLWTKKDGMQDLGDLGGDHTYALGINDRGEVVGYSNAHAGGQRRAFIWTKKDGMQDLGTLGGDVASASDINNRGQIVGYSSTTPGSYYPSQAFIWTKTGGMQDYGTLGGSLATPHSINKFGHFVGMSETDVGERHAFLWTDETGMQDLGTLGGPLSSASDLNDKGQVVGTSDTALNIRHAFIWDETYGMRDLNDLIPAYSGWELEFARGINKVGEIVGRGHVDGESFNRAYLLRPVK